MRDPIRESPLFFSGALKPENPLKNRRAAPFLIDKKSQVLNENARKPLSIGYLAFSLCSDILAALSVF